MEPGDGGRLVIGLPGGGSLGYTDFGDRAGAACFAFHGLTSSRLMPGWMFAPELLAAARVRMIGVDRPGYGLSMVPRAAGFPDWPAAVGTLADHLGIERFAPGGQSSPLPDPLRQRRPPDGLRPRQRHPHHPDQHRLS